MRILTEEVIGTRGGWVIKGRIVLIHSRIRRVELFLEKMSIDEVGWSMEDIIALQSLLQQFKQKHNEQ